MINVDAKQAVADLRKVALNTYGDNTSAVIGAVIDHIAALERTITLLRNGYESAVRGCPHFAVMSDEWRDKKWK